MGNKKEVTSYMIAWYNFVQLMEKHYVNYVLHLQFYVIYLQCPGLDLNKKVMTS